MSVCLAYDSLSLHRRTEHAAEDVRDYGQAPFMQLCLVPQFRLKFSCVCVVFGPYSCVCRACLMASTSLTSCISGSALPALSERSSKYHRTRLKSSEGHTMQNQLNLSISHFSAAKSNPKLSERARRAHYAKSVVFHIPNTSARRAHC